MSVILSSATFWMPHTILWHAIILVALVQLQSVDSKHEMATPVGDDQSTHLHLFL